jgi:hypothetical protein
VSIRYPQVPFILMKKDSRPGVDVDDTDRFNTLTVIRKPFEWRMLAEAVIEGLDFIDEGLLWRRQNRSKEGRSPRLAEKTGI